MICKQVLYGFVEQYIRYVNRDGKVDKTDKQLLLKHIAGITTLSNDVLWYADYNGDGSIDVSDAVAICVDYNITD